MKNYAKNQIKILKSNLKAVGRRELFLAFKTSLEHYVDFVQLNPKKDPARSSVYIRMMKSIWYVYGAPRGERIKTSNPEKELLFVLRNIGMERLFVELIDTFDDLDEELLISGSIFEQKMKSYNDLIGIVNDIFYLGKRVF